MKRSKDEKSKDEQEINKEEEKDEQSKEEVREYRATKATEILLIGGKHE